MRRCYQERWQGVSFSSATTVSFFRRADIGFYRNFYAEVFRRYASWEALPAAWRAIKDRDASWLAEQIVTQRGAWEAEGGDAPSRVLALIGDGVGFLEKRLLDLQPEVELHVAASHADCLRWLQRQMPPERLHVGTTQDCLPEDVQYNVIYLSAMDYAVPTEAYATLLAALRARLAPGGRCICLSASLLEEDSPIGSFVNDIKIGVRAVLHVLGIRRQQFWGWRRTRAEQQALLLQAGFMNIQDGRLDDGVDTYWISGE